MADLTFRLEYAPGFHPQNLPSDSDYRFFGNGRSGGWERGRQDDTEDMEPGKASFVVDDPNGSIFYQVARGELPPLTAVRAVVTFNGTDYVRFTGFMLDAPQPSGSQKARVATVQCVDWLGWASTFPGPGSKWAAYIGELAPTLWYRNDSSGGVPLNASRGDRVINQGSLGAAGDFYARPDPLAGYPMYLDAFEASPVPDLSGYMWASGYGSSDSVDYANNAGQFAFLMWFKMGAPPGGTTTVWEAIDPATGLYSLQIQINSVGSVIARIRKVDGSTSSLTLAFNHANNSPHLIIVRANATGFWIDTDLGGTSAVITSPPKTVGYHATPSSNTVGFSWTEVALLPIAIPGLTPTHVVEWVTASGPSDMWASDTAGERIVHIVNSLRLTEYPVIEDHTNPLATSTPATDFGGTLGSLLTGVASSRLGTLWMTADGKLRVRDFYSLTDTDYALQYNTQLANLTDVDLLVTPQETWGDFVWGDFIWGGPDGLDIVRRGVDGTTAGRLDRVINEVRVTDKDGFVLVERDEASRQRYGARSVDYDGDVAVSGAILVPAVKDIIAKRATPSVEVGDVTVAPWTTDAAATLVCTAELESLVHYHESRFEPELPGGLVDPIVYGSFRIIREAWSWTGSEVTVKYVLGEDQLGTLVNVVVDGGFESSVHTDFIDGGAHNAVHTVVVDGGTP